MTDNPHRPIRGLFDMFAELGRMREQWTQVEPTRDTRLPSSAWVPTLDIYADGDDLVIRCELAGIQKEEVEVSFSGGQLWISGERTGAPAGDDMTYYVRERRYGPFRRMINLPEGVEVDRIRATVEDGLLEIVIQGGAKEDRHEPIEITGADRGEATVDVVRGS